MDKNLTPRQYSGQQQTLYKDLLSKNEGLADMYLGALIVVGHNDNPDRYSHAAHGIRELIEKLPLYIDVQIKEQRVTLKSKVRELQQSCQPLMQKVNINSSGKTDKQKDKLLGKMKAALESFLSWFETHYPTRRAEIAKTLQNLDGSDRFLPEPLETLNVKYWVEMRDFFQAVAHHKKNPTPEEYNQWVDALERFLLDRLHPKTFGDFDEIDRIIQEGDSHA